MHHDSNANSTGAAAYWINHMSMIAFLTHTTSNNIVLKVLTIIVLELMGISWNMKTSKEFKAQKGEWFYLICNLNGIHFDSYHTWIVIIAIYYKQAILLIKAANLTEY